MENQHVTLEELVQNMIFAVQTSGRSPRTCQYYQKLLSAFLGFARSEGWSPDPNLITPNHIRHFLAWTASRTGTYGTGRGSVRHYQPKATKSWPYYKAIRRLYNWGIDEKLVENNPAAAVRYKAPPPAPVMPYSNDEIRAFMAVCELDIKETAPFTGIRGRACLMLFLDSGLRLKEMANLALGNIDLGELCLRVLGKGNKQDYCPFSKRTAVALRVYLGEREKRARTEHLWITESGAPLTLHGLVSWFRSLKRRAGNRSPGSIHRLRHTAALLYLRGARDSFLLQLFLRHNDLAMTRRYAQGLKKEEAILAHRNGASPVERLGLGEVHESHAQSGQQATYSRKDTTKFL